MAWGAPTHFAGIGLKCEPGEVRQKLLRGSSDCTVCMHVAWRRCCVPDVFSGQIWGLLHNAHACMRHDITTCMACAFGICAGSQLQHQAGRGWASDTAQLRGCIGGNPTSLCSCLMLHVNVLLVQTHRRQHQLCVPATVHRAAVKQLPLPVNRVASKRCLRLAWPWIVAGRFARGIRGLPLPPRLPPPCLPPPPPCGLLGHGGRLGQVVAPVGCGMLPQPPPAFQELQPTRGAFNSFCRHAIGTPPLCPGLRLEARQRVPAASSGFTRANTQQ